MGQREIDNFNRNAADFMARFGGTDRCQCPQCVKTRREGVIEGLERAKDIADRLIPTNSAWVAEQIQFEIDRLRRGE